MGFYHEWYVGTQFSVHFYPFSKTPNYCNFFLLPTTIRVVSWIKTFFGYFYSKYLGEEMVSIGEILTSNPYYIE